MMIVEQSIVPRKRLGAPFLRCPAEGVRIYQQWEERTAWLENTSALDHQVEELIRGLLAMNSQNLLQFDERFQLIIGFTNLVGSAFQLFCGVFLFIVFKA